MDFFGDKIPYLNNKDRKKIERENDKLKSEKDDLIKSNQLLRNENIKTLKQVDILSDKYDSLDELSLTNKEERKL